MFGIWLVHVKHTRSKEYLRIWSAMTTVYDAKEGLPSRSKSAENVVSERRTPASFLIS